MVGLTLPPYVLSRAIDDGLQAGELGTLAWWAAALLGVGALNAWLGIMRHRTMTRVRRESTYRTVRVVTRHVTVLGATLRRRVSGGEVATIGNADVTTISQTLTMTGPGVGAVCAYCLVAVLLLRVSPLLALLVLLGVPLLAMVVGPLLGRLHGAQSTYRDHQSGLTAQLEDIVGGLRVLNGLGGKDVYAGRYRDASQRLRVEGYRVGAATSWIQALALGLPTLFLAAVTWLAARMAAHGDITVGELVAVYGYAAVLVVPVSSFIEAGYDLSRGLVSARRVVRLLQVEPDIVDDASTVEAPASAAPLCDPDSGVQVHPGRLTALASGSPADAAAIVDRLARFTESNATWGGVPLKSVALQAIRDRILVADNEADIFAGSLCEVLVGRVERPADAVDAAVAAALAIDIVQGLPDGLDSPIDAQGRNLSGGQRQRVRLARALLADPEVLCAVEPTSSVDAHTESALASRLREVRAGRTTLVTTTSPLMLDQADVVIFLVDGRAVASGRHHDLLASQADYRALVARGADE